jgi:Family of unknown function (DUF5681)
MSDDPPVNNRSKTGKFAKGVSPNPAGRKKGARNRKTILAAKLMAGLDVPGILKRMEKDALKGDKAAARLILERTIPLRRGCPIAINLPAIKTAADCVAAMATVMGELARGTVSTIEASELTNVIDAARRTIETTELVNRVTAIEDSMKGSEDEKHS